MSDESEQKLSKFSSGIQILLRLDGLWKDANIHSRANLYNKWNMDLDRIWVELARDIIDSEYNNTKKKFDDFDKKIVAISPSFNDNYENENGFQKTPPQITENRSKHYKLLMEKELFLKRLENHLGKGTTERDDDEDGFD